MTFAMIETSKLIVLQALLFDGLSQGLEQSLLSV